LKYLVVIALVALLLVLAFRRLRPYVKPVRDFIAAVRRFRQAASSASTRGQPEKLVRCEACGIWVPATRALTSRSGQWWFCSEACLAKEKLVARRHRQR
jgi:hypothetical protein